MSERRTHARTGAVYRRLDPAYKSSGTDAMWAPLSEVLPGLVLYRDDSGVLYSTDEKRWLRDFYPTPESSGAG